MYYSNGNYEAFARPKKPEGIDSKNAYIIGTGLAALSAACYLVRDAQMPGDHIHVFEKDPVPGGACDGANIPGVGYVMRGGREMDNHFEVMWDLFRSIPSIETDGVSVLDEYYWLNKEDPNYSLCRSTKARGVDGGTNGKFALSDKASMEIMKLFFTPNEELYGKKISDFFDDEVFDTNFWMYWRTMFAFENWHSALEMKLYIRRYIHHIGGLPDFSALRFTRYNQYESMILPMIKYLEGFGVQFHYNVKVENVDFAIGGGMGPVRPRTGTGQDTILRKQAEYGAYPRNPFSSPTKKMATRIDLTEADGTTRSIDLGENDLVFITNGGCVENSSMGSQTEPAAWAPEIKPGGGWDMWRRIAAQDPSFGHPDVFCSDPEHSKWMSATVTTLDDEIPPYIQKICKRDPFSGRVVTGGIVTVEDSNWLMSWTLNRQQQFRDQPKDQLCAWVYGLFPRQARQLCEEADAGLHRRGDLRGVAVPYGRADRQDRRLGEEPRQHGSGDDAVHRCVLHAAFRRRPPRCGAGWRGEFRVPRPIRGDAARHDFHHRIFDAHRHGGRVHAVRRGPRRAGGVGFGLRRAQPAQRHGDAARRQTDHRYEAQPHRKGRVETDREEAGFH